MEVTPSMRWNRAPHAVEEISREENWTLNGPHLDNLTFIGGVKSGSRWSGTSGAATGARCRTSAPI
jgi:hypothetical protein